MSSAYQKFNSFVQNIGDGLFNLNSDSLYMMLSNVAPVATNTVYSSLTDLTTANGYTANGQAIASTAFSQTSGVATLTGSNVVWTASGGSIGPFEYATWYDFTSSTKPLGGFWSYGAAVTLSSGETFTVNLASGIMTLQ